jgi:hypothetical protein
MPKTQGRLGVIPNPRVSQEFVSTIAVSGVCLQGLSESEYIQRDAEDEVELEIAFDAPVPRLGAAL